MRKYKNYQEFYSLNQARFDAVQGMAALLKSPKDMSATGFVLAEAENLEHLFLNGANSVTELMFGLSASVLGAETNMNNVEGLLYGQKSGNATDKRNAVACDPQYVLASEAYQELKDLKDYLEQKRDDFMANHYFYKQFRSQK